MSDKPLSKRLQPALKALEKDLLERAKLPKVEEGLRAAWQAEKGAGETGQGFDPWRRARVTQIAVAWVLSVVFVRTLEDRAYIDPRIAGPDADGLESARDRESRFLQLMPFLGPREYLFAVFRELAHLPGAREVFDARHNPVWVLSPSSEGARALVDFFQQVDAESGAPVFTFPGDDTRFLGDLYQNLSEAVRKRYALFQTPEFVEKFILEQTLHPAIEEFGLEEVKLIDPTCGSGHFLLGAFRELLAAWQSRGPTTAIEDLARRALDQIYGVDINPYAVAVARFRLVLAVLDAVGIKRLDKAPALRPHVVVADSLLHRLGVNELRRLTQQGQVSFDEWGSWGDELFRLAEPAAVTEILGQRYHAVVGNPPYIDEKDASKRKKYREMYESAAGQYALAAPFTERFFDLAAHGGFVGMINSNAFTKRDFGKALIEEVLPRLDVQKVVDTSGCYLPGHGTPTLILFGRKVPATGKDVVTVLGKRGEQEVPANPEQAPVWSEIIAHHDQVGFDGGYVSVETTSPEQLSKPPWVLVGGGARTLLATIEAASIAELSAYAQSIGRLASSGINDVFVHPAGNHQRQRLGATRAYVAGEDVRDWSIAPTRVCIWPYDSSGRTVPESRITTEFRFLVGFRSPLAARRQFGKSIIERGNCWYELLEVYWAKTIAQFRIAFACVSTHNHFVLDRGGRVFNRHAPIINLREDFNAADYQALLGYLNSSTVGFWCRLVMFPKGGDQVGEGARLSKTPWQDRLEYAGNLLKQLPVPSLEHLQAALLDLVVAAEDTVQQLSELAHERTVERTLADTPTHSALREAREKSRQERTRLRHILVSLQEEMDWRVYGLFGLPTVEAASLDEVLIPVEPNQRPFEIRLAREIDDDISASEWFRIHKREPRSEFTDPLSDLYTKRLRLLDDPDRGRELRLLETPETKRRWSPPDEFKAFNDAVRTWLLERIEQAFRDQAKPELRTARQLALDLGSDPAVLAAHELLTEESGADLIRLLSKLVDDEGVPFLAGYRYTETGMEKRATWEESWRLQRLEDAGVLDAELTRLKLSAIPQPDKYGSKDYQRHYYNLRKRTLDVPKERFVTVPGANSEEDPTPLVGWAGWDHLQTAQALASLYQRRKNDAWPKDRLVPILAGVAERVPWLLQWHDELDPTFGTNLGQFFRDFVQNEAHGLGVAVDFTKATDDLRTWTPPAAPKKKVVDPDEAYNALVGWRPELDDEEDEESEPPEGPTAKELASEVGASTALVNKAIKKLLAEGRIEKLEGRPARYAAIGGEA